MTDIAQFEYDASKQVTAPLATVIVLQATALPNPDATGKIIHDVKKTKKESQHLDLSRIRSKLKPETARAVDLAAEKGASSWLSCLPLKDQGFALHKGDFRDALALRYNRDIRGSYHTAHVDRVLM